VRTTLDLDLGILQAAKEIAAARGVSAGQGMSELARKALAAPQKGRSRNGVPLLRRKQGAAPLTMATVNRLRDE